jgi:hypothetical protein
MTRYLWDENLEELYAVGTPLTLEEIQKLCEEYQGLPAGRYLTVQMEQYEGQEAAIFDCVRSQIDAECIAWLLTNGNEHPPVEVLLPEYESRSKDDDYGY